MKRKISLILAAVMIPAIFAAGCNNRADETNSHRINGAISVVSREEGSGTRGAFIELFGIEKRDENGNKTDHTTDYAEISNSTSVVMSTIAGNRNAIGYISLGALNDTVKALSIDGVKASADNIKNGTYKAQRPFNIAVSGEAKGLTADFISFILSAEGQVVCDEKGYIGIDDAAPPYDGTGLSGKLIVAGSSSVAPVMEALREAYLQRNPNAAIEIHMNDSTTGIKSVIDGIADIGMASRELKESELLKLTSITIALDGIAVIVNRNNPVDNLTSEQVYGIYTGDIRDWSDMG